MRNPLPVVQEMIDAARLRYALGFEEIPLPVAELSYEPRSSCQCTQCAAVWVGTKSGIVMHLALAPRTANVSQRWFPGTREARSVCHVHEGLPPGGTALLLVGRDDGLLEMVPDDHIGWGGAPRQAPAEATWRLHLDTWERTREPRAIGECVESPPDAKRRFAAGITAIAALPRQGEPAGLDLFIATRNPWLYVIEAHYGELRLVQRIPLQGWIDWIFCARTPDGPIRLLSRGGHLLYSTAGELRRGAPPRCHQLPVLPTAAMEIDSSASSAGGVTDLAVGTATGLVLIRETSGVELEVHAIPATRAGVHSIGGAAVTDSHGAHSYMTLGLEDGRLRVFDVDLTRPHRAANIPPAITRSFSVNLGTPVLAVQTLRPAVVPDEQVYMLAALRDHAVRLFRVTSEETQRERVRRAWEALLTAHAPGEARHAAARACIRLASEQLPESQSDAAAWAYAVIDVVLPDLDRHVAQLPPQESADLRSGIVDAACALIRRDGPAASDPENRALHRIAVRIRDLTGNDVGLALQLSQAVVAAAVAQRENTTSLLKDHVHSLAALSTDCQEDHRPKLVAWMRFIRKYILRGATFATKRLKLTELVERNYRAQKHIDALIYQARLHHRGYDLRWELNLGEDIAAVHSITWPPAAADHDTPEDVPRAIVVAITASARWIPLDRATGRPIPFVDEHGRPAPATLFPDDHGPVRVLTSAIVDDGDVVRLIVSGDGSRLDTPGLAVIELRLRSTGLVKVGAITYPRCTVPVPVRVYAITPLPGQPDTLVLGLNRRSCPVGRLRCRRPWVVECAGYDEDLSGPHHEPRHAPGTLPTRAVAAIKINDNDKHRRYLAALGSDDGQVLVCELDADANAATWKLEPWSLLAEPVASVTLGRHDATGRLSCYLGTSKGEVLALSIDPPAGTAPGGQAPHANDSQPFGPYRARALWRDSHRARVIAIRLWDAPMFADSQADDRRAPVMVTATANGRLCIYRHDDTTTSQLSARGNCYFRGIRYDRVVLPGAMQALALTDGSNELIASRPGGVVYLACLMYLRESRFRGEPDAVPPPTPGLPDDSWGRLHRLLSESEIDEFFDVPPAERWHRKLALCELIPLDDGVVANYALRERWRGLTPWAKLPADKLVHAVRTELRGLRADRAGDAARLKLIFKSVGGAFLSQRLDQLRDELLADPAWPSSQAAATADICKLLCDEILGHLSHTESHRSRLAIVGMKELVRVPVLRAIGGRAAPCRTARDAIEEVITACLRHNRRLVRTEALRAISVMLRNLGVMVKGLSPRERDQVIAALLPDEIDSVNWLIDPLIHDLRYFRSFKADNVLVSGAWYRASALAQLFWIFPDRALALCDHMVARGLPVGVLSLCIQVMRGNNVQHARHRIERFFFTDPHDREIVRNKFISGYRCDPPPTLPESTVDPNPDDSIAERYLAHLYDLLARMWAVERVEQLPEFAECIPHLAVIPRGSRRAYGTLVRAVNELAQIARDLSTQGHRVHGQSRLIEMTDPTCEHRKGLMAPVQDVASAIVAHWGAFALPPEPGMRVGPYELGACVGRRRNHEVFEIAAPADLDSVITVFRGSSTSDREAFVEAARFIHHSPGPSLAPIHELMATGSLYPAYRSPRSPDDLENYLRENPEHAARWATDITMQLCQALLHIHDQGRSHGDVLSSNIHVVIDRLTQRPSITLGGFGNAASDRWHSPEHAIPTILSQKYLGTSTWNVRRWHDAVALALLAFRVLVGEAFSLGEGGLTEQIQRLKRAMYTAPLRDLPLFGAIFDVLEDNRLTLSISELSARLEDKEPRTSRLPKVNVLFAAANPSDTTNLKWLRKEVAGVRDMLARQERWNLELIHDDDKPADGSSGRLTVSELLRRLNMGVDVIHFSGHGKRDGIAVWDHDRDGYRIVSGDSLGACFRRCQLTLVVLNSCYSEPQADAILSAIRARNAKGAVVGTSHGVRDEAAYLFSVTFYQQLAEGRSIGDASWAAHNAVGMSGLPDPFVPKGDLDLVLAPSR